MTPGRSTPKEWNIDRHLHPGRAAADVRRMPVLSRPRLLPGAPRRVLAAVVVLGVLASLPVVAPGLVAAAGPDVAGPAGLGVQLGLYGGLYVLLARRARSGTAERVVWRRLSVGAAVLGALVVVPTALGLFPVTHEVAGLLAPWAPVAAFPFFHTGLVCWNRYSTSLADPDDVLNGISGVLACVAVLNLVAVRPGTALAALPWTQVQPVLAAAGVGFVLLGTAGSVTFLGSMARDLRTWLVAGVFAAGLAAATATLLAGGQPAGWTRLAAPVGVVLLALAAGLRSARAVAQPTDPSASTVGAFVVIVASLTVLVGVAVTGPDPAAAWCAALAVLGGSVRLLVNVRELAQLAESRREALTDELTGLANRRAVLRRMDELCADGVPVAFALLDLDKFKEVNDGLGHAAGDDLLRLVAERLQPALRAGDVLGRLGGDEFAVVAPLDPESPADDATAALGRRLADRLAEPFLVGGMSVHVDASIGLTSCGTSRDGCGGRACTSEVLQQADAAMYSAKRSGAGVAVYDDARDGDSSGNLALVEELRAGLQAGELVLHHQPQVDVGTGRTVGVEALVRWAHPVRGLLGPADFLPLAEVHGLMGKLTDEVLRQAVAQAAAWQRAGRDLRVSVNLSASNLLDADLPRRVADLLDGQGLPAERLVLEITESVLLSDPDRSLPVVGRLAELGVTVSIDDFGTGYSSLSYLRDLPVAELKLDRSFTVDLLTEPRTEAIVSSTVALAHRLGLRVVAEGVEDVATLAHLAELDCDESQGYLHSRPLPADLLEAWLDRTATPREARTPVLLRS